MAPVAFGAVARARVEEVVSCFEATVAAAAGAVASAEAAAGASDRSSAAAPTSAAAPSVVGELSCGSETWRSRGDPDESVATATSATEADGSRLGVPRCLRVDATCCCWRLAPPTSALEAAAGGDDRCRTEGLVVAFVAATDAGGGGVPPPSSPLRCAPCAVSGEVLASLGSCARGESRRGDGKDRRGDKAFRSPVAAALPSAPTPVLVVLVLLTRSKNCTTKSLRTTLSEAKRAARSCRSDFSTPSNVAEVSEPRKWAPL